MTAESIGADGAEDEDRAEAEAERVAWGVLTSVNGLGPVGFARLVRRYGSARAILELARTRHGPEQISHDDLGPVGPGLRSPRSPVDLDIATAVGAAARATDEVADHIARLGLDILTMEDPAYPQRLLQLELPPPVLFVRGDTATLAAERLVAVVGTRRPTEMGRRLAAQIASSIAGLSGVVVSGLAVGIDGAAHAAAVGVHRPTIAVLGTGHARLYPRGHQPLLEAIVAEGGAVISELGPDVPGDHSTFPRRNRIISGVAAATVVVEAPRKSGALITAGWALEQGRECFIVPGAVGAPSSAGCLEFLRENHGQARVVATVVGLLEDLGFLDANAPIEQRTAALSLGLLETRLAALIISGHSTVDQLVASTDLPVASVLSGLTLLEMRGLIAAAYGRYWPREMLVAGLDRGSPARRRRSARPVAPETGDRTDTEAVMI
jgi:DNA processing protein